MVFSNFVVRFNIVISFFTLEAVHFAARRVGMALLLSCTAIALNEL